MKTTEDILKRVAENSIQYAHNLGKMCKACSTTGVAMKYPFPGADAHPDKRGGELCIEGTNLTVAEVLYELAYKGHAEARRDVLAVNKCLYGLADWLRTQNWMKSAVPGAGHVVGENCPKCGSVNYGPDGAAMADACWDCGYVKSEKFDVWSSIPVEKTHQQFVEEARRTREDLETAARATEVGKRYSAMSPEEFAALRKDADARRQSPPNTAVDAVWASKLSRALDVIERVTDERDRCTQARLAQTGAMPPGEEFTEKRRAAQAECEQQRATQAGGGFRCPKCETVFLDTGFPRLPGERGDGGPSGWRVTCPECKHEWNCLNHLTSVADRLADLEKDVRQLLGLREGQETDWREATRAAVEKRCELCVSWLADKPQTNKCVHPYCVRMDDTRERAKACGYWLLRADAPDVCPRCHSSNYAAGRCRDCEFDLDKPESGRCACRCYDGGPSTAGRLADLEKNVRQLLGLLENQEIAKKRAAEKRCGTCTGRPACPWQVMQLPNGPANMSDDGPPWDNCRFWKPKEK